MRAIQHQSNTRVLGAPQGWQQEPLGCSALPITDGVVDGYRCISSYWEPSPIERELLAQGGRVVLHIIGLTMPPVAIAVEPK